MNFSAKHQYIACIVGISILSTEALAYTLPVAVDDSANLAEDYIGKVYPLSNDSDADGDSLRIVSLSQGPNHGSTTFSNSLITYTPDKDYCGSDRVRYRITDGHSGYAYGYVNFNVLCRNDLPIALNDSGNVSEDYVGKVYPLSNDKDVDGDNLKIVSLSQGPSHGIASFSGTAITYTPDKDYCGTDKLRYRITDNQGAYAYAYVNFNVLCRNDLPVAVNDIGNIAEDYVATNLPLSNDYDVDGNPLSINSIATQPIHGVASFGGSKVTYTPNKDYCGTDQLRYRITDNQGAYAYGYINYSVLCRNDAPIANIDNVNINENNVARVSPLNNDTDIDGDSLKVVSVSTFPRFGSYKLNDDVIEYTPNNNYCGTDSLQYRISDNQGLFAYGLVNFRITCNADEEIIISDTPKYRILSSDTFSAKASDFTFTNVPKEALINLSFIPGDNYTIRGNNIIPHVSSGNIKARVKLSSEGFIETEVEININITLVSNIENNDYSDEITSLISEASSADIIQFQQDKQYCVNTPIVHEMSATEQSVITIEGNNSTLKQCHLFKNPLPMTDNTEFEQNYLLKSLFTFKEGGSDTTDVNSTVIVRNLNGAFDLTESTEKVEWINQWLASDDTAVATANKARGKNLRHEAFLKFDGIDNVQLEQLSISNFVKAVNILKPHSYDIKNISIDGFIDDISNQYPLKTSYSFAENGATVVGSNTPVDYLIFNKIDGEEYGNSKSRKAAQNYIVSEDKLREFADFEYFDSTEGRTKLLKDKVCPPYGTKVNKVFQGVSIEYDSANCQVGGNWNSGIRIIGQTNADISSIVCNEYDTNPFCHRKVTNVIAENGGAAVALGGSHRNASIENIRCNATGKFGDDVTTAERINDAFNWDNCAYIAAGSENSIKDVVAFNTKGVTIKVRGPNNRINGVYGEGSRTGIVLETENSPPGLVTGDISGISITNVEVITRGTGIKIRKVIGKSGILGSVEFGVIKLKVCKTALVTYPSDLWLDSAAPEGLITAKEGTAQTGTDGLTLPLNVTSSLSLESGQTYYSGRKACEINFK